MHRRFGLGDDSLASQCSASRTSPWRATEQHAQTNDDAGNGADDDGGCGCHERAGRVTGLLYGDTSQFLCQLGGATLCAAWAFGGTYAVFKVVNAVQSMRVTPEVELEGLDRPQFGLLGYPEDATASGAPAES